MIALIRYMLHDLLRSNRYFMPVVVYGLFVAWIYSLKPNPVLESYGLTMLLLFAVGAWFSVLNQGVESGRQQELTVLHAGGYRRYALARSAVHFVTGSLFAVYAILVPVVMDSFDRGVTAVDLLLAFYCHLAAFALGAGISWLADLLARQTKTVLGVVMVGIAASLAAGGLEEMLPDGLAWLTWLLPPVYRLMQGLFHYEQLSAGGLGIRLGYPLLYLILMYGLIMQLFVKQRG